MSLLVSRVPRTLEMKTKLFGFELADVLLIFLYLSVSNLFFGTTVLKPFVVWMGTAALAAVLYFTKRDKPDGYIQHWGEFQTSGGVLSVGIPDTEYTPYFPLRSALGLPLTEPQTEDTTDAQTHQAPVS